MGVLRDALTVGGFTLFSRVVGFIRECITVFCLGAGLCADALMVALRISNTFRRIFAEGAFNASFLPRFSKVLNERGKKEANAVLSDVFSVLLLILIPFSIIVILFFPSFLKLLLSGFDTLGEKFQLSVVLGRICFPYLILISVTSLFCGVLNTVNKFALPAAVYSLLSVFTSTGMLIGYFLDLSDRVTVQIVAWFVLLSGMAQTVCLLLSIRNHGFGVKFRFSCLSEEVKDILKNMIPGIIGAGVWQLNLLIDTTISSYFPTGTITCVNLADRLNQFPLGTLGIALGTALLPVLSQSVATKEYDLVRRDLEKGLSFAFFLTLFATSVLAALNEQSVAVAFQRGMFGSEQVKISGQAVSGFVVGLPAYVLTKVFSALYFAFGDTKSPVIFGVFSVFLNLLFLILLVPFLKYFGLAFCMSLSASANAFMLIYFSGRKISLNFSRVFWIKISAQATAALATYFSLVRTAGLCWHAELGAKAIKWPIYFGLLGEGVCVFLR
ncbi:MAG: murein biosynthesis integral membrane protein MurJ [Holosporaceae bacterium]|jgi:putative peptidoglycan lipid II flippase|nr:murein biosynthesis integral membrane protein MurJ [Holosporaceae bacterium]